MKNLRVVQYADNCSDNFTLIIRDLNNILGGPTFKQNDVRFVRPKTLLNEVESLYEVKFRNNHRKRNSYSLFLGKSGSSTVKRRGITAFDYPA